MQTTEVHTNTPKTLFEFAGVESKPSRLSESVLIIIDAQREFTDGNLKLEGIETALKEAKILLDRARKFGVQIIHVKHRNKSGAALFAPESEFAADIALLKPEKVESIVFKPMANAFANSSLDEELQNIGRKNLKRFRVYDTHGS